MRILRICIYIFISLVVILWIAGWLIGRSILLGELNGRGLTQSFDLFRFKASDVEISGFPFYYRIDPKGALIEDSNANTIIELDDRFSVQVSLLGSAAALLTGSEVGARLNFPGTYDLGDTGQLSFKSGWAKTDLRGLTLRNQENWVWGGLDLNFEMVSLSVEQEKIIQLDALILNMEPQGTESGYTFDLAASELSLGNQTFDQVPNSLDSVSAFGRIQPDLRASYVALGLSSELLSAREDPLAIISLMAEHGETIAALISSSPGIYVDRSLIKWGDSEIESQLSLPVIITPFQMTANFGIDGSISFSNVGTLLEDLLREPVIRQNRELTVLVGGIRAAAPGLGIDLNGGRRTVIEGTLVEVGREGIIARLKQLKIDGKPLPF